MPSRPPAETLPTPGRVPLWPPRYLSSCGLFPASLPLSTSHSPSFQGQASTKGPVASRPDLLTCQSSPSPAPVSTSPSEPPWLRTRDPTVKPSGHSAALAVASPASHASRARCHLPATASGPSSALTPSSPAPVLLVSSGGSPPPSLCLIAFPGFQNVTSPVSGILSPRAVVRYQATQQEVSKRSSRCIRRRAPAPAPPPQPHPRSSGVRLPGARKAGAQRPT